MEEAYPNLEGLDQVQYLLERMLETLTEQNQLLVDLLGAVNALTAATLGVQARLSGPRD